MSKAESLSTSRSLIERIRDDSPAGWRIYADLYGPLIAGWCWQAGFRDDALADVVQNVHLAVVKKIRDFRHGVQGTTFRGWLRVIARNQMIDWLRKTDRIPQPIGDGDRFPFPERADEAEDQQDFVSLVCRTLEMLKQEFSRESCEAFEMHDLEGASFTEIAAAQGITAAAARMRVYRVRKELRRRLISEWPA